MDDKEAEKLQKQNAALKAENESLVKTQQELKAKVKQLTEQPPKITSGHVSGSVKYQRQKRN